LVLVLLRQPESRLLDPCPLALVFWLRGQLLLLAWAPDLVLLVLELFPVEWVV
jgi:hypothetical protein